MGKKHKKKKLQQKSFPWALMTWGGVLLVAKNPDFLVHVLSNWGP
jgi:hypothetical protein